MVPLPRALCVFEVSCSRTLGRWQNAKRAQRHSCQRARSRQRAVEGDTPRTDPHTSLSATVLPPLTLQPRAHRDAAPPLPSSLPPLFMSHFRLNSAVVSSAQRTGRLDLHGRSLYSVPLDVFAPEITSAVTILDLSENHLTTLPSDIQKLERLKELHLDNNKLTSLPIELLLLRNLKAISLENNPHLPRDLQAVFEKASPIFKSRARDVVPVLAWLADQVRDRREGGEQSSADMQPRSSPIAAAGRNIASRDGGRPDSGRRAARNDDDDGRDYDRDRDRERERERDRDRHRERDYRDRDQPAPSSQQQAPVGSGLGAGGFDDEYIYAQLRARSIARANEDREGGGGRNDDAPRDRDQRDSRDQRDERDDRDNRDARDRNDRDRDVRGGGSDSRRDSRDFGRQGSNSNSNPVAAAASRYSYKPVSKTDSPFAVDSSIKMENRGDRSENHSSASSRQAMARVQAAQARGSSIVNSSGSSGSGFNGVGQGGEDAAAIRNKQAMRSSNIFADGEQPKHNRKGGSYNRALSGVAGAPFGTDDNAYLPPAGGLGSQSNRGSAAGSRAGSSGSHRVSAPFGTDHNVDLPPARRHADPERGNQTAMASPWAVDGRGNAARVQDAFNATEQKRGVRITRPGARTGADSSPFGTLPADVAASHYTTSSASAASHVQAAARMRAAGGLDVSGGGGSGGSGYNSAVVSPKGGYGHFDDGSISGNGPRNSGGLREAYGRPNSDVYARGDQREVGDFSREQRYAEASDAASPPLSPVQGQLGGLSMEGRGAGSRRGSGDRGVRHQSGHASAVYSPPFARDSDAPPTPTSKQLRPYAPPFARDTDAPPEVTQAQARPYQPPFARDTDEPMQQGSGSSKKNNKPVQDTRIW